MMREPMLLKIGEFARLGQVSIATLHYYDECGLLKPYVLDGETGYRFYAFEQLMRLHHILALKELGFPLEQVARMVEGKLSLEQLRGMFMLKEEQVQQMIECEQARLERIRVRLRQIEEEGKMPTYDVQVKDVEAVVVASIREMMPIGGDLERGYEEIMEYLKQVEGRQVRPKMTVLHSRYEVRENGVEMDMETAVPIAEAVGGNGRIRGRTLEGGKMACTVHVGNTLGVGRAYMALKRWMEEHGYRFVGAPRLVHLSHGRELDTGQYVTEIQFPVEKV